MSLQQELESISKQSSERIPEPARNIMQNQISRSRMNGDPPDLTVAPRLDDFHLMDFHRAAEAIEAGHAAIQGIVTDLPYGT